MLLILIGARWTRQIRLTALQLYLVAQQTIGPTKCRNLICALSLMFATGIIPEPLPCGKNSVVLLF